MIFCCLDESMSEVKANETVSESENSGEEVSQDVDPMAFIDGPKKAVSEPDSDDYDDSSDELRRYEDSSSSDDASYSIPAKPRRSERIKARVSIINVRRFKKPNPDFHKSIPMVTCTNDAKAKDKFDLFINKNKLAKLLVNKPIPIVVKKKPYIPINYKYVAGLKTPALDTSTENTYMVPLTNDIIKIEDIIKPQHQFIVNASSMKLDMFVMSQDFANGYIRELKVANIRTDQYFAKSYKLHIGYIPTFMKPVCEYLYNLFVSLTANMEQVNPLTHGILNYGDLEILCYLFWELYNTDLINWDATTEQKKLKELLYATYHVLPDGDLKTTFGTYLQHNSNDYSISFELALWVKQNCLSIMNNCPRKFYAFRLFIQEARIHVLYSYSTIRILLKQLKIFRTMLPTLIYMNSVGDEWSVPILNDTQVSTMYSDFQIYEETLSSWLVIHTNVFISNIIHYVANQFATCNYTIIQTNEVVSVFKCLKLNKEIPHYFRPNLFTDTNCNYIKQTIINLMNMEYIPITNIKISNSAMDLIIIYILKCLSAACYTIISTGIVTSQAVITEALQVFINNNFQNMDDIMACPPFVDRLWRPDNNGMWNKDTENPPPIEYLEYDDDSDEIADDELEGLKNDAYIPITEYTPFPINLIRRKYKPQKDDVFKFYATENGIKPVLLKIRRRQCSLCKVLSCANVLFIDENTITACCNDCIYELNKYSKSKSEEIRKLIKERIQKKCIPPILYKVEYKVRKMIDDNSDDLIQDLNTKLKLNYFDEKYEKENKVPKEKKVKVQKLKKVPKIPVDPKIAQLPKIPKIKRTLTTDLTNVENCIESTIALNTIDEPVTKKQKTQHQPEMEINNAVNSILIHEILQPETDNAINSILEPIVKISEPVSENQIDDSLYMNEDLDYEPFEIMNDINLENDINLDKICNDALEINENSVEKLESSVGKIKDRSDRHSESVRRHHSKHRRNSTHSRHSDSKPKTDIINLSIKNAEIELSSRKKPHGSINVPKYLLSSSDINTPYVPQFSKDDQTMKMIEMHKEILLKSVERDNNATVSTKSFNPERERQRELQRLERERDRINIEKLGELPDISFAA